MKDFNKNYQNTETSKNAVNVTATANTPRKDSRDYSYYSRVLEKPFDSLGELKDAEARYFAAQKAKEDKAAAKKADATKVEEAFKALNAARKAYKDDLTTLTKEYSEALKELKDAFELGKKDIHEKLASAEETYSTALKAFTEKYPEGYHLTLKDGDFETTISSQAGRTKTPVDFSALSDIFDFMFRP
jgi:chromosome segregation ATPase